MPVICLHYDSLAFGKLTCCSFNEMCQVIGTELLLQRSPIGSIKWNSLHWNTLLCVNNKITPWGPGAAHLTLDLCVVCMVPFKLAVSINSLTEKIWVLAYLKWSDLKLIFVSGNFTSASPKWSRHPKSTTLPSGDPLSNGISKQTTKSLLKTFTGVFQLNMTFSYCSRAIGSCFKPCSTYLEVKGFGFIMSAANFSWFLCLFTIKSNFEAVNLNLRSFFQHSDNAWSLVASSMLLIMVSSTTRELMSAFSEAFKFSGHTKSLKELRGNLG